MYKYIKVSKGGTGQWGIKIILMNCKSRSLGGNLRITDSGYFGVISIILMLNDGWSNRIYDWHGQI